MWVCEKQIITKWPRDILSYKERLTFKLTDEESLSTGESQHVSSLPGLGSVAPCGGYQLLLSTAA
jgi:hypothetical protein